MEPINVVVALAAHESAFEPRSGHLEFPSDSEYATPYRDRLTVELDVDPAETVGDVLRRAAEKFGVPFSVTNVAFNDGSDDERLIDAHGSWSLVVLDEQGRATWRGFAEVPYGELVRAAEAGAVNGDPLRPYLTVAPQIGDGVLPDWSTFVQMVDVFKTTCEVIVATGSIVEAGKMAFKLARSSGEGKKVLEEHSSRWEAAGADPYTFDQWLDEKPWHSADLAALLGCSRAEAEAVLWALGFGEAASGVWRRGENEEAKLLAGNRKITISTGYAGATEDQLGDVFRERVEQLARTGQSPPEPDWQGLKWLQTSFWTDEEEHPARSLGDRIGKRLRHVRKSLGRRVRRH